MWRLSILLAVCTVLAGCETAPPSGPGLRQQAQADLVVRFQSWNSMVFLKPNPTAMTGAMSTTEKPFTAPAFEKVLRNLKVPRDFVVVVLDRRYRPDPVTAHGGMDFIGQFFQELGFRRIAFQDGAAPGPAGDLPILRDRRLPQPP